VNKYRRSEGKILTLGAAAATLGSSFAGWTGPWSYEQFGVWGLAAGPAVALSAALVLMGALVNNGGDVYA
jgi:hypothetical protein